MAIINLNLENDHKLTMGLFLIQQQKQDSAEDL